MGDIVDRLEALNIVLWTIKEARAKSTLKDDNEEDNDDEEEEEEEEEENSEEGCDSKKLDSKKLDEADALVAIKNKVFVAAVTMTMSKLGQGHWESKSKPGSMGSLTGSVLSLLNA